MLLTEAILWNLLRPLADVEQTEKNHPEGNALNHTFQVFNWALRETDDYDLIVASLLHDVGKAKGMLNHVHYGLELVADYVSKKTIWLIANHMRIWTYINGDMQGLKKCKVLAEHKWLPELIQLARWDKKGRNPHRKQSYDVYIIAKILEEKEILWKNRF